MKHTQESKRLAWMIKDRYQLKGINYITHLGSMLKKNIQELKQLAWTIKKENQINYNPTRLKTYMRLKKKLPRI
jgi:hypothetical protein